MNIAVGSDVVLSPVDQSVEGLGNIWDPGNLSLFMQNRGSSLI